MNLPSLELLLKDFSSFLFEGKLSAISVKNYTSDLRHFFSFCTGQYKDKNILEISQSISKYIEEYSKYQKSIFTPTSSLNRRLASIRRFQTFLQTKKIIEIEQNTSPSSSGSKEFTDSLDKLSKDLTTKKVLGLFKNHLEKEKKTNSTIKNYVSDLYHYFGWIASKTPFTVHNLDLILSTTQLDTYVSYLKLIHTSTSVINRRTSSIKKLSHFCALEKFIPSDPFERKIEIVNLSPVSWFRRLIPKPIKPSNTPKNRFAVFYDKYHALPFTPYLHLALLVLATTAMAFLGYNQIIKNARPSSAATSLTPPKRQLSFQGRLYDSTGTPITTAVNVIFKLFNAASGPTQLYTSGTCSITPDEDGIFNTLIGDTVCGSEISQSVFADNRDVYLEVTVGAETLTPRQQIATVGYALNSETLQGYPASAAATINTVPVVDNNGDITIAVTNPSLVSTSGTFNIEGQAISLTTATNSGGDIILQPDALGSGQILALGGTTTEDTFRITNANLTTGSLISGYVGNDTATGSGNLLLLSSGATESAKFWVTADGRTNIHTATASADTSALIVNQNGTGNIFSASSSGVTKFLLNNLGAITTVDGVAHTIDDISGNLTLTSNSSAVSIADDLYTTSGISTYSTAVSDGTVEATKFCTGDGETNCVTDFSSLISSAGYWSQNNGALFPSNSTVDLFIGGQSTASAMFAFLNVNSGTPTASISSDTVDVATFIDGNGNISTTNRQSLVLGNSATYNSTGNILLNPSGMGNIGIGDSTPDSLMEILGTTEQLRLSYTDGSADSRFSVDSSGNLTINNTGTDTIFSDDITVSGGNINTGNIALTVGDATTDTITLSTDGTGNAEVVLPDDSVGPNEIFTTGQTDEYCLTYETGGTWEWQSCGTGSASYWDQQNGTLYPLNSTVDLLIGGQSTASAMFAFLNVNSGTPTASISSDTVDVATYIDGNGNISTTNKQTLTLGGTPTGNVVIAPGGVTALTASGANVNIAGDLTISGDDLFMGTNTSGMLLIADGTNFNPTAVSGDITINGSGVTAIGNDKITEAMLKSVNGPTDELCLSYESTVGDFEWQNCGGGASYWDQQNGSLYPLNSTVDVFFGGQATSSAKFAFLNNNSGTPTASIAGSVANQTIFLDGDGNISTTNRQSLVLGNSATYNYTGNVLINPNGTGNVGIGTTTPTATLDVAGDASVSASFVTRSATPTFDVLNGGDLVFQTSPGGDAGLTTRLTLANNGNLTSTGTVTASDFSCTDCLDFSELEDTLDLDANLTLNQSTNTWTQNFTGTTTDGLTYNANSLTSGDAVNIFSTSTGLTTGNLLGIDWSPGSSTTATGDLFSINIGTNGTVGNLFNVKDTGSSLFSISETAVTSNLPTSFTSPGDVSIAYDLLFTNPTASYIKSAAPLYIQAGETFNSSDLNLQTYNKGNIIVTSEAFVTSASATISGNLRANSTTTFNGQTYTWPGSAGSNTYVLQTNGSGTLSWVAQTGGYWDQQNGSLYPLNSTVDVFFGGQATTSAKFAFLNNNSGTPTASIAGSVANQTIFLDGDGNISTTNRQSLVLGNSATYNYTGNILLNSNGTGNVGIGDATPLAMFTVGSGDKFQVDSNGNIIKLNNVTTSFPSSQGAANSVLVNNGSGTLSWADPAGTGTIGFWSRSADSLYPTDTTDPVGIGFSTALSDANAMLEVDGDILPHADYATGYNLGSSTLTWNGLFVTQIAGSAGILYVDVDGQDLEGTQWNVTGALRVGDTTNSVPSGIEFYVAGDATVSGTFGVGGKSTFIDTVTVGANGDGKIDVGTVDPPYTINGEKYATYMSGMVGVKEEVVGNIATTDYVENIGYRKLIDLDQQPKGSDIWLFAMTTEIKKNINKLSVLLTGEGQTKTWYELDKTNNILAIYSSSPTNVSYRLTAPRFDSHKWTNNRTEGVAGFILNTEEGGPNINSQFDQMSNPNFISQLDGTYKLVSGDKEILEVTTAKNSLIANLQAGAAVVADLLVDNLTIRQKLISPIADIDKLKVNDATVSGTLYANNIKGQTIDRLDEQLDLLNEKYSTASAILADLQAKYGSYSFLNASSSSDPLALSPLAGSPGQLPSDLPTDILAEAIFAKSLSSFDTDLYIQPTGDKPVHLLANLMTLYPDGKVLVNGDLLVTGNIFASNLDTKTATVSGSLALGKGELATDSGKLIALFNDYGEVVGSVDASGSAHFGNITTPELIIAAGNTGSIATNSAQTNSNASIGTASIATNSAEIFIPNNKITDNTLVYITPISDTGNQVIYVKSKQTASGFTVAVPQISPFEILFNYWLIQTK